MHWQLMSMALLGLFFALASQAAEFVDVADPATARFGSDEMAFASVMHAGVNHTWIAPTQKLLHDTDPFMNNLLTEAMSHDVKLAPSDGLVASITALRRNEQYSLALVLIEQALSTWGLSLRKLSQPGTLPIDHLNTQQRYLLEDLIYEAALCAWYSDYRMFGLALSDILLLDPQASERSHKYLWSNVGYYVTEIAHTRKWNVDIDLPLIMPGSEERYRPLNPSIVKDSDGYTILCKTVNFDQIYGREYYVLDDTGYVNIRNFVIKTDKNLVRTKQYEIVDNLDRVRHSDHGLEDLRITRVRGTLWFTAFTRSVSESGNSLTVVGSLGNKPNKAGMIEVDNMVTMEVYDPEIMEKNWLPYTANSELLLAYSVGPNMVVLRPDVTSGANETLHWQPSAFNLNRFRGSAGPVPLHFNGVDGQLFSVHEVVYAEYAPEKTSRTYYHRFVFVDDRWIVTHLTRPFIFEVTGVEFCTGMVESHDAGMLLVSVGIQDREARIFEIPIEQIKAMLVEPSLLYW